MYVCVVPGGVSLFTLWAWQEPANPSVVPLSLSGSARPIPPLCLHNLPALTQWTTDHRFLVRDYTCETTVDFSRLFFSRIDSQSSELSSSIFVVRLLDLILFECVFIVWESCLTRSTFPPQGIGFQVRQLLMCLSSALLLWQLNFPQGYGTFLSV